MFSVYRKRLFFFPMKSVNWEKMGASSHTTLDKKVQGENTAHRINGNKPINCYVSNMVSISLTSWLVKWMFHFCRNFYPTKVFLWYFLLACSTDSGHFSQESYLLEMIPTVLQVNSCIVKWMKLSTLKVLTQFHCRKLMTQCILGCHSFVILQS